MNKSVFLFVIFGAVSLLLNGCGMFATVSETRGLERDLRLVKEQVSSLEDDYNSKLEKLDEKIEKFGSRYSNTKDTSLKNQASFISDLDEIRSEFRRVKGEVEEIAYRTDNKLKEDKGKLSDYEFRLRELELGVAQLKGKIETLENNQKLFAPAFSGARQPQPPITTPPLTSIIPDNGAGASSGEGETPKVVDAGGAAAAVPVDEGAGAPEGGTAVAQDETASPEGGAEDRPPAAGGADDTAIAPEVQAEYDKARAVFSTEKFDDAMKLFTEFIKKYPDTELTDNAQFWVAECYYKQKEFDKAILEYDKMVTTYPDSDKIPSALLKEGFSFLLLNYKDEAINILKKLVKEYPDTNQAEIARRKLKVVKP